MYTPAADIFGPALVIPEQFFAGAEPTSESSGERRLMFAILDDAVHSIQSFRLTKNAARRDEYDEARRWMEARDVDWTFSFENICDVLGLDAGFMRERLLNSRDGGPSLVSRGIKPQIVSVETRRRRLALESGRERDDEVPEVAA